jgi:hypothetical protein
MDQPETLIGGVRVVLVEDDHREFVDLKEPIRQMEQVVCVVEEIRRAPDPKPRGHAGIG